MPRIKVPFRIICIHHINWTFHSQFGKNTLLLVLSCYISQQNRQICFCERQYILHDDWTPVPNVGYCRIAYSLTETKQFKVEILNLNSFSPSDMRSSGHKGWSAGPLWCVLLLPLVRCLLQRMKKPKRYRRHRIFFIKSSKLLFVL